MTVRLGIFATHPVQYHVPLWRALARKPGLDVKVHYFSDHSVRGGIDPGFGVPVAWDVPLLEGYKYEFITRNADLTRPYTIWIRNAKNVLQKERFDWVLIQGYTHAFEWQITRSTNYRVVMRGEFSDISGNRTTAKAWLRELYLKWFYRRVDAFCYIGRDAYCHLKTRGITDERLFFSPYSIDNQLLEAQIQKFPRDEARQRLGLEKGCFVFLFSGKLIHRKMPLLIADAIKLLPEVKHLGLLVIGDGPLREALFSALHPLLQQRLIVPGFVNQSELGSYFAAADALILPSSHETWGLVINEAMQFGLPVIASDRVGCKDDLVLPGKTGFVFTSGNADELAQAMKQLMNDPRKAARMGEEARCHVQTYTVENAVKGILQALNAS